MGSLVHARIVDDTGFRAEYFRRPRRPEEEACAADDDMPLLVASLIEHADATTARRVVSRTGGPIHRCITRRLISRQAPRAGATRLGVTRGDRVGNARLERYRHFGSTRRLGMGGHCTTSTRAFPSSRLHRRPRRGQVRLLRPELRCAHEKLAPACKSVKAGCDDRTAAHHAKAACRTCCATKAARAGDGELRMAAFDE